MIIFRPKEKRQLRLDAIRADFHRRYNSDELREQLFKTQEGLCHICKKPIQSPDGVVSEVDHVISAYLYATWDYPIGEACEHANALRNLTLVHSKCNAVKNNRDYEEFAEVMEKGEISLVNPVVLTPERLEENRRKLSERGRKAGLAAAASMTPEQRLDNSRKANASMTPEQRSENARKATASLTPEQRSENGRKGALILNASITLEQKKEYTRIGSRIVNCLRWNIRRGKPCTCGKHEQQVAA